jgi:hypothetical protein
VIVFRHADPRLPFLIEGRAQTSARWHDAGEASVHYFADTPDGAWAEFLRHEEIGDPADLAHVRRAIWAVEIPDDEAAARPALAVETMTGDRDSYPACRAEARRLRATGATRLEAPSAALVPGGAHGFRTSAGLRPGPARDGRTIVLFGPRPSIVGWRAVREGRPAGELLQRIRRFGAPPAARAP